MSKYKANIAEMSWELILGQGKTKPGDKTGFQIVGQLVSFSTMAAMEPVTSTSDDENSRDENSKQIQDYLDLVKCSLDRIRGDIKSLEAVVPYQGRATRYKNLIRETKGAIARCSVRLQEILDANQNE